MRPRCHKILKPHARIRPYVEQAGLLRPTEITSFQTDSRLICALLERWRPETHTFILPTGECTITLEDIHMLLGLKVDGLPVTSDRHISWTDFENLLGRNIDQSSRERKTVKLTWLRDYIEQLAGDESPETLVYHFRAYCLYLIGSVLFPDKTGNLVHIKWLAMLEKEPIEIGTYSWGSACLSCLYRGMCDAAYKGVHDIMGCTILIQAWAYSRITCMAPKPKSNIPDMFPLFNRHVQYFF